VSEQEFNDLVSRGRALVILDEFVLDVDPFIKWHLGGRFVLTHNIGKDVSKFFNGGYALEGNMGARPASGYRHSNFARKIVNQLVVGQF
jgi:cytochrome b involved in lipid metabolism